MEQQQIHISSFPAVSNTALMTLYCRAWDYTRKNSILKDRFSYDLYNRIVFDWKTVKKRIYGHDQILNAIRARKFDRMCTDFLGKHPKGIVVSLGAGLDNRFLRIDNGQCLFIELDLPEVIDFKHQIIIPNERYILIGKSVLDFSWINQVKDYATSNHQPVFFVAEGLFPYLDRAEISELFKRTSEIFPQSEIFFDICGEKAVKMMSKHSGIQDWNLQLKSGFSSGQDLEKLGVGFKLISEWYFPDDPDAKKGLMKLMWIVPLFKKSLYFLYGRLDHEPTT